MFSRKDLMRLIFPLVIEQILAVTIGMADTAMVAVVGEAAVSGISLVDTLNLLLINIFAALATGGAVIVSQYLGRQDLDNARTAAGQLLISTLAVSLVIAVFCLFFRVPLLRLIFGTAEADVMQNALDYFFLSCLSYPFLALYNAGAALFRSMGNSKVSMYTSFLMNAVNIGGNAFLIYVVHMGVKGAALASLASRALGAFVMLFLLRHPDNPVYIESYRKIRLHPAIVRNILKVGVPNGLENSVFQVGKVLVQGLIASFGTAAIAANAIANNTASLEVIPGSAIGLAMITVIGQCIGAGDAKAARYYTKKLMKITVLSLIGLNAVILVFARPIANFYGMSPDTTETALLLMYIHGIFCQIIWPFSFTLPNALRAGGDAKFTMVISILSMWTCRIGLSYLFANTLGMGVVGVWAAMICDWTVRAAFFIIRFRGDKWTRIKVI